MAGRPLFFVFDGCIAKPRDVWIIAYAVLKIKTKSEECGMSVLYELHIQTHADIRNSMSSPCLRVCKLHPGPHCRLWYQSEGTPGLASRFWDGVRI